MDCEEVSVGCLSIPWAAGPFVRPFVNKVGFVEQVFCRGLQLLVVCFSGAPPGDNHHVPSRFNRRLAERFSYTPPGPVADHRIAGALSHQDAETALIQIVWNGLDYKQSIGPTPGLTM